MSADSGKPRLPASYVGAQIEARVQVAFEPLPRAAVATAIGPGGLVLALDPPVQPGLAVSVGLMLPDDGPEMVAIAESGGAGPGARGQWFRFLHLDVAARGRLTAVLAAALRHATASEEPRLKDSPSELRDASRDRILVVDDDLDIRNALVAALSRIGGAEIVTAETCAGAREAGARAAFSVAVLDIRLPDGDGLTLGKQLREFQPDLEIIVMTSHASTDTAIEAIRLAAFEYLPKPFDSLAAVRTGVERAIGRRKVAAESRALLRGSVERLAQANSRLAEVEQVAVASERLAELGRVSAGIMHEIKTPLSYIAGNLELLLRAVEAERVAGGLPLLDEIADFARESLEGAERIRDVATALGQYAHAGRSGEQLVDLRQVVEWAVKLVRPSLKPAAKLETHLASVPQVHGSPGKLTQVLVNLLNNAADAVAATGREPSEHRIVVRTVEREGGAAVEVEDNGCGIPPDVLARVFEPFFTTKPPGKGTGLGLTLCREIAQEHRGRIDLQASADGTRATLWLPGVS